MCPVKRGEGDTQQRLGHSKSKAAIGGFKVRTTKPSDKEGSHGDVLYANIPGSGFYQFVKIYNSWKAFKAVDI